MSERDDAFNCIHLNKHRHAEGGKRKRSLFFSQKSVRWLKLHHSLSLLFLLKIKLQSVFLRV